MFNVSGSSELHNVTTSVGIDLLKIIGTTSCRNVRTWNGTFQRLPWVILRFCAAQFLWTTVSLALGLDFSPKQDTFRANDRSTTFRHQCRSVLLLRIMCEKATIIRNCLVDTLHVFWSQEIESCSNPSKRAGHQDDSAYVPFEIYRNTVSCRLSLSPHSSCQRSPFAKVAFHLYSLSRDRHKSHRNQRPDLRRRRRHDLHLGPHNWRWRWRYSRSRILGNPRVTWPRWLFYHFLCVVTSSLLPVITTLFLSNFWIWAFWSFVNSDDVETWRCRDVNFPQQ